MSALEQTVGIRPRGLRPALAMRTRYRLALGVIGAALVLLSIAPFISGAIVAAQAHKLFTGAVGTYPMDMLQYLSWMHDARNGLIRNLFGPGGAVFIHPIWSPSGWVQALTGIPDPAIVAFWTVAGSLILFSGCLRLVRRHIPPGAPGRRLVAVLLAVFGGFTPLALYLERIHPQAFYWALGDVVPAMTSWGQYVPLAIAIGLMPFVIERFEAVVSGQSRRAVTFVGAATLGLLVSWLHPWQGETLICVAVGLAGWRAMADRNSRPLRDWRLALVLACTAAPILYYLLLSRLDAGWAVSERLSAQLAYVPADVFLYVLAPIAVVWLVCALRVGSGEETRGLVLWPAATLLVVILTPSGQYRAIDGLVIPVAVLAVKAWPTGACSQTQKRARLWGLAAVVAALLPSGSYFGSRLIHLGWLSRTPYGQINRDDARAVRLAAREAPAGELLTSAVLGPAVPALADHRVWIGHTVWTPDRDARIVRAELFLNGGMLESETRTLIGSAGITSVVQPCGYTTSLAAQLAPLGFREQAVGCAHVYARGA